MLIQNNDEKQLPRVSWGLLGTGSALILGPSEETQFAEPLH